MNVQKLLRPASFAAALAGTGRALLVRARHSASWRQCSLLLYFQSPVPIKAGKYFLTAGHSKSGGEIAAFADTCDPFFMQYFFQERNNFGQRSFAVNKMGFRVGHKIA